MTRALEPGRGDYLDAGNAFEVAIALCRKRLDRGMTSLETRPYSTLRRERARLRKTG